MNKKLFFKLLLLLALSVGSSGSFSSLKATSKSDIKNKYPEGTPQALIDRVEKDEKAASQELSGEGDALDVPAAKSDADLKDVATPPKTPFKEKIKKVVCFDGDIDYRKPITSLQFGLLPKNPAANSFSAKDPRFKLILRANWGFEGAGNENMPLPGGPKFDGKKWIPDPVRVQFIGEALSLKVDLTFLLEKILYGKLDDFVSKALDDTRFSSLTIDKISIDKKATAAATKGNKDSADKEAKEEVSASIVTTKKPITLQGDQFEEIYKIFKDSEDALKASNLKKGIKGSFTPEVKEKIFLLAVEKYLVDSEIILPRKADSKKLADLKAKVDKDVAKKSLFLAICGTISALNSDLLSESVLKKLCNDYYLKLPDKLNDKNVNAAFEKFITDSGKQSAKGTATNIYIKRYLKEMGSLDKEIEILAEQVKGLSEDLNKKNTDLTAYKKELADLIEKENKENAAREKELNEEVAAKEREAKEKAVKDEVDFFSDTEEPLSAAQASVAIDATSKDIVKDKVSPEKKALLDKIAVLEIEISGKVLSEKDKGSEASLESFDEAAILDDSKEEKASSDRENEKDKGKDVDLSVEKLVAKVGYSEALAIKSKALDDLKAARSKRFRQEFKPWIIREILHKDIGLSYEQIDSTFPIKRLDTTKIDSNKLYIDEQYIKPDIDDKKYPLDLADVVRELFKIFKHEKRLLVAEKELEDPARVATIDKVKKAVSRYHFLIKTQTKIKAKQEFLSGSDADKAASTDINSIKFLSTIRRDPIFPQGLRTLSNILYFMTRFTEMPPELVFLSKAALLLQSAIRYKIKAVKSGKGIVTLKDKSGKEFNINSEVIRSYYANLVDLKDDDFITIVDIKGTGKSKVKHTYDVKVKDVKDIKAKYPEDNYFPMPKDIPGELITLVKRLYLSKTIDTSGNVVFFDKAVKEAFDKEHPGAKSVLKGPLTVLIEYLPDVAIEAISKMKIKNFLASGSQANQQIPLIKFLDDRFNDVNSALSYKFPKDSGYNLATDLLVKLSGKKEQLSLYDSLLQFAGIAWRMKEEIAGKFDQFNKEFTAGSKTKSKEFTAFIDDLKNKNLYDKFKAAYSGLQVAQKALKDNKTITTFKNYSLARAKCYGYVIAYYKSDLLPVLVERLTKLLPHIYGINTLRPILNGFLKPSLGIDLDTITEIAGKEVELPEPPKEDEEVLDNELAKGADDMEFASDF